jgi:hypothetical protein
MVEVDDMNNREMDAYIAEKCLGYKRILNADDGSWTGMCSSQSKGWFEFKPTESMTDAWPVFEWLLENHPWAGNLTLGKVGGIPTVIGWNDILFAADTFMRAICNAAHAACEEIERIKNGAE